MSFSSALKRIKILAKPFYLISPRSWPYASRTVDARIAVSPEGRFVYIRVPKAANSTITSTLFRLLHGHDAESHAAAKESFRSPRSLGLRQALEMKRNYIKFTFVRNPYDRVLSAYLDKICNEQTEHYRKMVRKLLKIKTNTPISFTDFCHYLKAGGVMDDPHWMPQSYIINSIGLENIHFIGKVENLAEDMNALASLLFANRKDVALTQGVWHATGASSKHAAYYNEECLALVSEVYRNDFADFGYPLKSAAEFMPLA